MTCCFDLLTSITQLLAHLLRERAGSRAVGPRDADLQHASMADGVHDTSTRNHLHASAVLRDIELRFAQQVPKAYVGQICVAVSPYQWLDLYRPVRVLLSFSLSEYQ